MADYSNLRLLLLLQTFLMRHTEMKSEMLLHFERQALSFPINWKRRSGTDLILPCSSNYIVNKKGRQKDNKPVRREQMAP